ncbi:MAG: hypothetical protein AAF724_21585 [Pseudomonadota bacterium]
MSDQDYEPLQYDDTVPSDKARRGGIVMALIAITVVFGVVLAWQWWQIAQMRAELAALSERVSSAQQNDALLAEAINSNQDALLEQFAELSGWLQNKVVDSTNDHVDKSVAEAIGKLSAFGNASFAFQMVEFDRRSCVNGGIFSGERATGDLFEEPFGAGEMVEIQPSHTDIRGIPFYRVNVNGETLGSQQGDAEFRHGSMRIACN